MKRNGETPCPTKKRLDINKSLILGTIQENLKAGRPPAVFVFKDGFVYQG